MKSMLIAAFHLLLVVVLAWGAAVPSIDEAQSPLNVNEVALTKPADRTGRERSLQPLANFEQYDQTKNHLTRLNNGLLKPLKFELEVKKLRLKEALEKVKTYAIAHADFIIWGVVGTIALAVVLVAISVFTGFDGLIKPQALSRPNVKGLKLDSEHINVLANRVYNAIDYWKQRNAKLD